MTDSARVRQAVQEIRTGETKNGYRSLLEGLFEPIEAGLKAVVGSRSDERSVAIFDRFVDQKLHRQSGLLDELANAKNPASLVYRVARNFAIDELRRSEDITDRAFPATASSRDSRDDPMPALAQAEKMLLSTGELWPEAEDPSALEVDRLLRRRQQVALEQLSEEDQLLLALYFVERSPVPPKMIEAIAKRRGVPHDDVVNEIARRRERLRAYRSESLAEVDARRHRFLQMHQRYQVVLVEQRGRGTDETVHETKLPALGERELDRLRRSTAREARVLSGPELESYRRYVSKQIEQLGRLIVKAERRATDRLPGQPGWEELARIAGIAKANTVNQRVRRALLRLQGLVEESNS